MNKNTLRHGEILKTRDKMAEIKEQINVFFLNTYDIMVCDMYTTLF